MNWSFSRYLFVCPLVVICMSAFFSLNGQEWQSRLFETPWDTTVIGEIFPNQNASKLITGIPPELQDLHYAIYPTSPEYNTARLIFNKRFVYFPKAIFYPRIPEEAQFVLGALRKHHLKFAVRSGGHCFEPGSLSSGYIIDLKNFNSIVTDIKNEEVRIGAGCVLGTVIATLGKIDYAIPTGTCPTVGVTGYTLGGGIGLLGRTFGLTCDSVKSMTVLTADSEIIEVNASNYPDLFWALLGGGNGSYGIVLEFTFKMYYIPELSFYELIWEWDPNLISPVLNAWQKWIKNLPNSISSVCGVRHPNDICAVPIETPPLVIRVFGLKVSSEPFTEWEEAFKDLKPRVKIFTGRYIDLAKFWAMEPMLPFNKAKSKILMKPMTQNVIRKVTHLFEYLEKRNPNFLVYFNFEAFGGEIAHNQTSFFPSQAMGWWFQAYYWEHQEQSEEVLALSRRFYSKIPREVSNYCYANIVDYDLGERYLKLYYGDHVSRLIKVKDQYDPTNLFHWKQGIPTSLADPEKDGTKKCHPPFQLRQH